MICLNDITGHSLLERKVIWNKHNMFYQTNFCDYLQCCRPWLPGRKKVCQTTRENWNTWWVYLIFKGTINKGFNNFWRALLYLQNVYGIVNWSWVGPPPFYWRYADHMVFHTPLWGVLSERSFKTLKFFKNNLFNAST